MIKVDVKYNHSIGELELTNKISFTSRNRRRDKWFKVDHNSSVWTYFNRPSGEVCIGPECMSNWSK